jgi:hypothetical protein
MLPFNHLTSTQMIILQRQKYSQSEILLQRKDVFPMVMAEATNPILGKPLKPNGLSERARGDRLMWIEGAAC